MPKATYSVVAVLPGRRADYDAFHRGTTVNDRAGTLDSGKLFINVEVEALSKTAAEDKVRALYPRYSIDSSATVKLG